MVAYTKTVVNGFSCSIFMHNFSQQLDVPALLNDQSTMTLLPLVAHTNIFSTYLRICGYKFFLLMQFKFAFHKNKYSLQQKCVVLIFGECKLKKNNALLYKKHTCLEIQQGIWQNLNQLHVRLKIDFGMDLTLADTLKENNRNPSNIHHHS